MAKELSTKFSVDLSEVVNNSIEATRAIRKTEQARKEAEFQRAIANGLSYEAQIAMREAQLDEERSSSISDSAYIATLEKSIGDTKKLNRFNKYRTRYAESLGELSAGKINEQDYLNTLKNQLNGIDDPDLRLEIQGDIATGEAKLKTYNDTILGNQVKKAKFDGTKSALDNAISRVNTARAQALINDNQDEVTAYDETLSALNSQMSGVRIQDSITDFQVRSSTRGTNPVEKLNHINSEIQRADPNTAIKIGDRTFTSAQQFWSLERDNFLAGNSQIFGKFFDELNTYVKNNIDTATAKFGYPTQNVLDSALLTFNELRSKPELTPFVNRLDVTQASAISEGADKYAQQLIVATQGTSEFSFKQADAELQKISARYGIDLTARRVQLQNLSLSDQNIPEEAVPELALKLPGVEGKPTTPSAIAPITPAVPARVEAPIPPPTPPIPPAPATPPAPTLPGTLPKVGDLIPDGGGLRYEQEDIENLTPPTPPSPPAPVAPVSTTPTPTPPTYTGSSIVDYLKSVGQDSSVDSRAKLAVDKGIVKSEDEYLQAAQANANATMNEKLLETLRKQQ